MISPHRVETLVNPENKFTGRKKSAIFTYIYMNNCSLYSCVITNIGFASVAIRNLSRVGIAKFSIRIYSFNEFKNGQKSSVNIGSY